jgi:octaprenyl-diphosphate synthase
MKVSPNTQESARSIFELIEPELREVEDQLKSEAISNLSLVEEMNSYLHESGGKRLRPSLVLLVCKSLGVERSESLRLGTIVELIHVATLVHDDIIDNSGIRRGRESVNAKWGNEVTVLFGDWLYMTAFWVALKQQDFRVLDILIDITRKMVEGELLQLQLNNRLDNSVEDYLRICWHKTAHLFSGCGRLSAILGNVDEETENRLADYGESIGMAFQLVDDLLDYTSSEETMGKPVLKDLTEGTVTLPIIELFRRAPEQERAFLKDVVETGNFSEENKRSIIELVRSYGTLEESRELARKYAARAHDALEGFPPSVYRDALLELPELILIRNH